MNLFKKKQEKEISNFYELCFADFQRKTHDSIIKLSNENKWLKAIEKEHQKINGELRKENKQLQNNWNELKNKLERRIKSYEDRKKLGEGYELTEVMEISLACDKRFLKEMQELEQGKDE